MLIPDPLWDASYDTVIREFLYLRRHRNFLDVGCGSGLWTSTLHRLIPSCRIMGIDLDLKSLKAAKNRFDARNADFVVGDAHFLPLKQRCFDLVTCRRLLMNIRRRRLLLGEMKRVAKQGGVVAAVEPSFRDASEFSTELNPRITERLLELVKRLDRERVRQMKTGDFADISAVPFFFVRGIVP